MDLELMPTTIYVMPCRCSTNKERLDPFNGISLSPLYDRAFDKGYITFSTEGTIELSPSVPVAEVRLLGLRTDARLTGLGVKHGAYLNYHRSEIWAKRRMNGQAEQQG
ncbi:MAG: HNH endonuclease [Acidobacteria bacterium]|nr:HNH endonuclease [Acidobacteriota bacterium]